MDYWKYSINNILVEKDIEDEAVVGLSEMSTRGQSSQGSSSHSPQESLDHRPGSENVSMVGVTIACKKYGISENLLVDEDNVMDVRSKGSDSRSIPNGMAPTPLIFLMGKNGAHKGVLN
ncbi:PROF3 protein, partial [Regulus satrapa]|nr:PROF3 protein [Regulus satrapa]